AEELILKRVSDPHYFVFSDDIEWCRTNLSFAGPTRFVDDDFGPRKFRDDLRLMSACKHFVIANSSFSWWAAWLNPDSDKTVIAPTEWFRDPSLDTRDLIPEEWLRI
ncbi:MAG TPA: alpha-1,2-fucosyltransferase, partial [Pyrinomonadaceae bacterium]